MTAKGCRAAKVMGHHVRVIQLPVDQKFGEKLVQHAERDILAFSLFGLPVAEQVENEHLVTLGQGGCDTVPNVGREWRAMDENYGRSFAQYRVADRLPAKRVTVGERPFRHRRSCGVADAGTVVPTGHSFHAHALCFVQ